jgi:hypothetical protein
MAYAADLKSAVPNGACGFDPHPGHQKLSIELLRQPAAENHPIFALVCEEEKIG